MGLHWYLSRSTGANVISAGCIYRQKLKAQTVTHNRARTQCTWAHIPKKGSLTRCLVMKYHPWHYAGLTWPPSLISRPGASDPCRIAKRCCSGARWAFRSIFIRWQKPATWTRVLGRSPSPFGSASKMGIACKGVSGTANP